jgi:hypothetical protein
MSRTKIIIALVIVMAATAVVLPHLALASTQSQLQAGANAASGGGSSPDLNTTIGKVVNLLSSLVGVLAVIMLIVGGFRYVTSGGNQENTKNARSTIIYALVGLVIVGLAQSIVRFVLHAV